MATAIITATCSMTYAILDFLQIIWQQTTLQLYKNNDNIITVINGTKYFMHVPTVATRDRF